LSDYSLPINIRIYRPEDFPFILDSCARSISSAYWNLLKRVSDKQVQFLLYRHPISSQIPQGTKAWLVSLLREPGVQCLVAVNPHDENGIYGYIVGNTEKRTLHYIFVKRDYRQVHVGTNLIQAMFPAVSDPNSSISAPQLTYQLLKYRERWNLNFENPIFTCDPQPAGVSTETGNRGQDNSQD